MPAPRAVTIFGRPIQSLLESFPAPKFYRLNTSTNTVSQSGFYFASATSDDFNASIAANDAGDCFVTWTSTDTSAGRTHRSGCRARGAPTRESRQGRMLSPAPRSITRVQTTQSAGVTTLR